MWKKSARGTTVITSMDVSFYQKLDKYLNSEILVVNIKTSDFLEASQQSEKKFTGTAI